MMTSYLLLLQLDRFCLSDPGFGQFVATSTTCDS